MDQRQSAPRDASFGEDALSSVRTRVLRGALNVLAIGVPTLGGIVLVSAARHGGLDTVTIVLSIYTLSFPLLRLGSARLGFKVSVLGLLGLLALTAFLIEARGGVVVGSIALNLLVLMLSAVFFGRRGAALGLLGIVALFVVAGCLVIAEMVPTINVAMWDPRSSTFWIRQTVGLVLFGFTIVVTQVYVVERLAREAQRLRNLAEHEQRQRLALERSERKRREAQRALEESRRIEALARLAGGIAHDFNSALTVIMSTAEVLKEVGNSRADVTLCADEIRDAAKRAAELTRQLLTLGRRQVSQPQALPMASWLTRIASAFQRVLPSDVVLSVDTPNEAVVARVDPAELERALLNLIINARDAMPNGGKLTIGCNRELLTADSRNLARGSYVALTVSDTGVGMAPEIIEHIFDPFFTTKTSAVGSGLGLATVYAFAKESGGDIRIRSIVGVGTQFQLLLPEELNASAPEARAEAPSLPPPSNRGDVVVLIVEDRADVRANMVRVLARGGFVVVEASDGDAALARLLERGDFAVMCIDGVMPGAATADVIARARQLLPTMGILLCSGYLQEDLLRRGVATGDYAFLQKPFSGEQLLGSVRALLTN